MPSQGGMVAFTGADIPIYDLLVRPQIRGVIPADWHRLSFVIPDRAVIHKIDRWIGTHMIGRWASYAVSIERVVFAKLAFEEEVDIVLFRLSSGETAWDEALEPGFDGM